MSSRPVNALPVPPGPVAVGGVVSALLVGLLLGARPHLGFGLLVALIYTPLVLINLRAGISAYVVLLMISTWAFVSVGPTAASILILFGWLGTLRDRAEWAKQVVTRRTIVVNVAFFGWLTLTALWAREPNDVLADVWYWYVVGLHGLVFMTTFSTRRSMQTVLGAYVGGACLSVLIGFFTSGFAGGATDPSSLTEGRLVTGFGDPNALAAGLVPGIMIAVGLFATVKSPLRRFPIIAALAVLVLGLAATQSRGGFLAMVVALLAACVVFKERRAQMLVTVGVAASLFAIALTVTPGAWQRVTDFEGGGAGRSDLWHVAWRISQDHPLVGVGLNNFRAVSSDYVRQAGNLNNVHLVVEQPHLVHNLYLQLLTEAGIVGLVLFLCIVGGSLAACRRAALNFDRRGERALATLSRSLLCGLLGALAASFFLSTGDDPRKWLLLGLGPALLGLSRRTGPALEE